MTAPREPRAGRRAGGPSRPTTGARHRAREIAFRVAYEADVNGDGHAEVWARLREEEHLSDDQRELVDDVVAMLARDREDIDRRIQEAAEHWPLARLSATDRAVLRMAVAELVARAGSPVPVVLDVAIELAKRFGSDESGRFVNGVLDRIARDLRPAET